MNCGICNQEMEHINDIGLRCMNCDLDQEPTKKIYIYSIPNEIEMVHYVCQVIEEDNLYLTVSGIGGDENEIGKVHKRDVNTIVMDDNNVIYLDHQEGKLEEKA